MAKFKGLSEQEQKKIATEAIDWAMNGHVRLSSTLSDMEQYVEYLRSNQIHFEDEDALLEFLEAEAAKS